MSDFVEQVRKDVAQRREQLLEKHRELTDEDIISKGN